MTVALLGTTLLASMAFGQRPRNAPGDTSAAPTNSMSAARGARHLLRNGSDYLSYQEYERALQYFREAETRQFELTAAERQTLKLEIERAQRGMREAADAPHKAYAKSQTTSRPGAIATNQPNPAHSSDAPVQRVGVTVTEPTPEGTFPPPPTQPAPRANRAVRASFPAAPNSPIVVVPETQPIPADEPRTLQAPETQERNSGIPTASQSTPAEDPFVLPPLPGEPATLPIETAQPLATMPEPVRSSAGTLPNSSGETIELPPLPGEAVRPSPPPEPLPTPVGHRTAPAIPSTLPDEPGAGPLARESESLSAPAGPGFEDLPPLPGEFAPARVTPRSTSAAQPAPRVATRLGSDRPAHVQETPGHSTLSPELRREVEQIAQRQESEAAQRNLMAESEQPTTQLELPRAPSPTEARPLRAIPVPEEFIPLAPRQWAPSRKYWAAAATCHMPLYFQDAALERYGHSAEQFFGPTGRFLTYPIDDPTQSNQRNQIVQPFMSAGLLVLQIAALPYNLIVDPPWEAEYDLGYWRPGDRIPNDLYYLPWHGVGPPLRGSNY
jgi:hypothetical protein